MYRTFHILALTVLAVSSFSLVFATSCTDTDDKGGNETVVDSKVSNEVEIKEVEIKTEDNSPEISDAGVRITSPGQDSILGSGKDVYVTLETRNFETGVQTDTSRAGEIANSGNGQHIHLIVDNKPYMAVYDESKSVNIGLLEPGPHTIFAFPSRSYHESVKSEDAADILNFYVGEAEGSFELTDDTPSIIYSRPKGEYSGKDAKKIMLDFYLNNVVLSPDGYSAKYEITDKADPGVSYTVTIDEWKPAFIYNLPPGEYTVKLQLIDKDGSVVEGAYNSTERDITVVSE